MNDQLLAILFPSQFMLYIAAIGPSTDTISRATCYDRIASEK